MTDIQLCNKLLDALTLTPPADTVDIALTNVSGSTLQLATSPGGTVNQWVGAIIEVTSGAAIGSRAIITESNVSVIKYASPFIGSVGPEVGDTVKLIGGPLATARLYLIEPYSVKNEVKNGIKYFVSVNCIKGEMDWKGFGGHSARGAETMRNEYTMEVALETPDAVGEATAEDSYNITIELPTLKEQVIHICHRFKADERNRISSDRPIKWTYGYSQRQGSPVMRCCMVTFVLKIL